MDTQTQEKQYTRVRINGKFVDIELKHPEQVEALYFRIAKPTPITQLPRVLTEAEIEAKRLRALKDKEAGQILTYMELVMNFGYKGKKLRDLIEQYKVTTGRDISARFLQDMVIKNVRSKVSRVSFVLRQANLKTKRCLRFYGRGAWKREVLKVVITPEEYDAIEAKRAELVEAYKQMVAQREAKPLEEYLTERQEKAITKLSHKGQPCIEAHCKGCNRQVKYYLDKDIETNHWSEFCFSIASMSISDIMAGNKLCWRCEKELAEEDDEEDEVIESKPKVKVEIKQAEWNVEELKEYIRRLGQLNEGLKHWFEPLDFCERFRADKKFVDKGQIKAVIQEVYNGLGESTRVNDNNGYIVVEMA